MALTDVQTAVQPLVAYFGALLTSGFGVALATQTLKADVIPIPAQKYPRLTAIVLSIGSTFAAVYLTQATLALNTWVDWTGFGVGVVVVSAGTYHALLKNRSAQPQQ